MKKTYLIIPIIAFLAISVFFYKGLFSDPTNIENVSLHRDFPAFHLGDLMDSKVQRDESEFIGKVTLVNVWGTWCVTCRIELPFLTQLREQHNMRIVGVYYDNAADAAFGEVDIRSTRLEVKQMLGQLGDPFIYNVYDKTRDLSLDLGITGAPESFLVNKAGKIIWHRRGDINSRIWQSELKPLFEQALAE
ncbi:thiol:disulfide interchange protein [Saccharobesus litoralis]|uniref:Thiol:disulfide interchange protein n=1 Tax=Saccharobesus litoralis TaxID=2172099 RepID=A0A2S0VT92_9ALTE|nr:redoxin family protein [Saccharobesus litoralis]AWB67402.1 thiol:disulfide interchange protein [Saccharobesus litoralis]